MTMMRPFRLKAIDLNLLRWIELAKPIFGGVYRGQMDRALLGIGRVDPANAESFISQRLAIDPPFVEAASIDFYERMAIEQGRSAFGTLGVDLSFDDINQALLLTASDRARWFSEVMTQTSLKQTQDVITAWRESGGTINELKELIAPVWTGPRPDAAAVTESTNMTAQARRVVWQGSGVVQGYNVRTANDPLVRPRHTEVANGGPYPLSDVSHLPPIDGDVNCRCFTTPVLVVDNG